MNKTVFEEKRKDYSRRKSRWESPGWILSGISLCVLVGGLVLGIKSLVVIGILFLSIGGYLIVMGRMARKTLFNK